MQFFRKLKGKVSLTGQVTLRIRTLLDGHLWRLAQEHAERAGSASESDSTPTRSPSPLSF